MPNYVPIQDMTISHDLEDTDLVPVSDGETSFAVEASRFKAYSTDAAEAAAAEAVAAAAEAVASVDKTIVSRASLAGTDDLDNFIDKGGSYYCSRANAATVGHSPWDSAPYVVFVRASSTSSTASGIVQYAVSSSGQFACRFRQSSTWSDWVYASDAAKDPLTMITRGSIPANADLDDYYTQSGMWYCAPSVAPGVVNTPWSDHTYVLFVKPSTGASSPSGQAQIAVCYTGELATRMRYQEAWTSWAYITTSADDRLIMKTVGSLPDNCDLDDYYQDSGMWYASSTVAGNSANVPWDDIAFSVFVKASSSVSSPSGQTQIAISVKGDLATRSRFVGSWSPWVYYAAKTETSLICLSVFSKVGVIGASYDTGASPNVAGTANVPNPNNAWLNILSRKYGFATGVYAYGGATIQSWYDPSSAGYNSCYGKFAADTPCELYFIALGGNGTIDGSLEDCAAYDADPSSTPTTFYGYYAKLIHDILEKNPLAAIVCCLPASVGIRGELADAVAAITEIGNYYALPVLNLRTHPSWRKNGIKLCTARTGSSLHPTPLGHAMLAQTYDEVFGNVVMQYASYFNTWRNEPPTT